GAETAEVELVEGYRILSSDGAQITDGMVLAGKGSKRELLTGLEAKAGRRRASDLHLREERRESAAAEAEREAYAKDGAREGKTARLKEAESGGQVLADRERLLENPKVRIYDRQLKTFEEVEIVVTERTRWIGAAPKDVSLTASAKAFGKHPVKIDFRTMELPVSQPELAAAEAQAQAAAGRRGQTSFPFMETLPRTSAPPIPGGRGQAEFPFMKDVPVNPPRFVPEGQGSLFAPRSSAQTAEQLELGLGGVAKEVTAVEGAATASRLAGGSLLARGLRFGVNLLISALIGLLIGWVGAKLEEASIRRAFDALKGRIQ